MAFYSNQYWRGRVNLLGLSPLTKISGVFPPHTKLLQFLVFAWDLQSSYSSTNGDIVTSGGTILQNPASIAAPMGFISLSFAFKPQSELALWFSCKARSSTKVMFARMCSCNVRPRA